MAEPTPASSAAQTPGGIAALNSEVSKMNQAGSGLRVPVFGFSAQDFKLPCGYVDEKGVLHNTVVLQQMTGVEEEMMADDNLVVTDRITNILSSCCTKLGTVSDPAIIRSAVEDNDDLPTHEEPQGDGQTALVTKALPLTAADRMAMLLFLRITSVGNTYRYDTECPYCERENKDEAIKLDALEIKYVKDPTKRLAKIKLPRSGVEVVLKILTGKGESEVAQLASSPKNARTLALIARIVSINGDKLPPLNFGGIALVKQMPYEDRLYLRRVFDLMEGSIDSQIEVTCRKAACAKVYKFSLDLGQVFFSPPKATVLPESIEWM